jgi:protoporphyrin/coproporphyrin ferrochelatase
MRIAVLLFNLGGPDRPDAIQPFLRNLFSDPAIISLPQPFRWLLARLIAKRRGPVAAELYARIGGASPILENTQAQARALETGLAGLGEVRVFVCMRYWNPLSAEVAPAVARFAPKTIILLPLYPQFSTTTTASSFADWRAAAAANRITAPTHAICCYPRESGFVNAVAELTRAAIAKSGPGPLRVLFSAHGLPKRTVERKGDPYPRQVELSAAAIAAALAIDGLDWRVCYQSRVGPLEWTGPYTQDEISRAGREGRSIVLVPIAFVSEHSETLVELDIEYAELAHRAGVPRYVRVPAVAAHPQFVAGLAGLVRKAIGGPRVASAEGSRICPAGGACGLKS